MNIRKFKETVSAWDNYEENFRLFRVWAENCFESVHKKIELDIADNKLLGLDYAEDYEKKMKYKWEGMDIQAITNLYNKMGWTLGDLIRNKDVSLNYDEFEAYYDFRLSDLGEKFKAVEDNVEFCYGILWLIKQIKENDRLYHRFVTQILMGLKEYNLNKCASLIDINTKKVFVAMWFDDSMTKARKNINEAIKFCGYEPMLIDMKEHNNQIVPEIFKEIEDSEFVIADLTGHRGGVYYEAGYAMAKGKTVILSCKDGEDTHFDVAQINTIYWKNEEDLFERLVKRIRATVGENI